MSTTVIIDELNALGARLRTGGNLAQAAEIFGQVARMQPGDSIAQANAAAVHVETGFDIAATGDMSAARAAFERAIDFVPRDFGAHWGLYETNLVLDEPDRALSHQRIALGERRIVTQEAQTQPPVCSVLALYTPGTFQANIPLDFVIDTRRITLHKLYLTGRPPGELPPYDIVFNAIADAPDAAPALLAAQRFIAHQDRPALNAAYDVPLTSRDAVADAFAASSTVVVAPLVQTRRSDLPDACPAYPFLIRPIESHAGNDLAKIADAAELAMYLAATPHVDAFYLSAFVDYRNADGFFRKYRIAFVDGAAYPVHLAISPRWMIHYYNAAMAENAWMRDEEHAFMRDLHGVFDGVRAEALREIAATIPLDYFGIDCSIAPDGRVLLFEASAAMLVHMNDPIDLYPYKAQYVPRIVAALERLFLERIARGKQRP
jgi:hypothetical protein